MPELMTSNKASCILGILASSLRRGKHYGEPLTKVFLNRRKVMFLTKEVMALKKAQEEWKIKRANLPEELKRIHKERNEKHRTKVVEEKKKKSKASAHLNLYRIAKHGLRYRVHFGPNLVANCKTEHDANDYVQMQKNKPKPRHTIFG